MSGTPRVVLDTNVCLDLFVFDDPRTARLHAALRAGGLHAVTVPACRDEWRRVLAYRVLALDDARRAAALAAYDALHLDLGPDLADVAPATALPRCADPDDQKFLELALTGEARWLLSRDRALLALARRTRRAGLFDILEPERWDPDAVL